MRYKEIINEGLGSSMKNIVGKIFSYFSNLIQKIKFGQRVEINLGDYLRTNSVTEATPKDTSTRETFDLTSIIGYYNEFSVAWKLAYGLEYNGVNITTNVTEGLKQYADNYRKYILDNIEKFKQEPNVVQAEIQRAEDGSEIMAKKMFDEITTAHDVKLIDAEIRLTGKEAMGAGKEDVKITIYKRNTDEVVEMIKASLKLYKSPSGVNVYNATFASYLISVLTGNEGAGTGKKAIASFLEANPQFTDELEKVVAITDKWKEIKTRLKREEDPDYRKTANAFVTANQGYQKMRNLLFRKMFDYFYQVDKAGINERILHRLGLNGADDIYLLVGTKRQQMVAVSSRTSAEFKRIYSALKAGFNVRYDISDDPDIVSCTLVIASSEGEDLAKFTISFKEGTTFPHMWNMTKIVNDARKNA